MQIYVCVKHVPDTAANIKVAGESGYDAKTVKFIVNPYDEYAVEAAVRLVEQNGGEVVLVSVGPSAAANTLRSAMAMGAHRSVLVKSEAQFLDSAVTARALAAAITRDGAADLVFTGKGAVDSEGFQTPYRLASQLGLPVANEVVSFTLDGGQVRVQREIGGGAREVLALGAPCVLGATKGLNEPRYPKFPDIMKAKKKPIEEIALGDLVDPEQGVANGLASLVPVAERSGATMVPGATVTEQVTELVRILKEDEKVL